MINRRRYLILALFLPLAGALVAGCPAGTRAAGPVATITDATGDVTVVRVADGDEEGGEEDLELFEGDTLRTAAGAKATITFLDEHLVSLGERSTLVLRTIRVNPASGTIWGRVRLVTGSLFASLSRLPRSSSGFRVETNSAVAAVKGTTFSMEETGAGSTVSVLEGTVATSGLDASGRETAAVDIPAGQETSVDAKTRQPRPPRAFLRESRRLRVRERLEGIRNDATKHRDLRRSGELGRLRRLRNLTRASCLLDLQRTDPGALAALPPGRRARLEAFLAAHRDDLKRNPGEVRRFLERNPEARERLRRQSERRMRGHRGARGGADRPARPERPARNSNRR